MPDDLETNDPNSEPTDLVAGGMIKPFLEHLEDLRWTIIKSLVAIVLGMVLCLSFVRRVIYLLQLPLIWSGLTKDPSSFLISYGVADSFSIAFKVGIFGGLLVSLPLILFFIGQFVLPALTKKERNYLAPAFTAGAFMFLAGAAACFFLLLPQTLTITYQFSKFLGFQAMWTIQSYMSFTIQFMIGLGLAFEMPVVILFLVKMGILSYQTLKRFRPHVVVINFIFAAVITPTTDALTLCLVAVPMVLLYEMCILVAWWMDRSKKSA